MWALLRTVPAVRKSAVAHGESSTRKAIKHSIIQQLAATDIDNLSEILDLARPPQSSPPTMLALNSASGRHRLGLCGFRWRTLRRVQDTPTVVSGVAFETVIRIDSHRLVDCIHYVSVRVQVRV